MQVPVYQPDQSGLPLKICFDIENKARRTLAYILGGILAIIGITLAHRRIRALERQVLVAQEGQITERFTRAIEQLGSDKMEIRLGGIYALERIANDSDKDYWPIMETLTAYLRERRPLDGSLSLETTEEAQGREDIPGPSQADYGHSGGPSPSWARRKYLYGQGRIARLDLHRSDLRGADLWGAHIEGADAHGSSPGGGQPCVFYLEWANLGASHLEGADLS